MNKTFIDVAIRTSIDSGEIMGALNKSEFLGSWEEEGIFHIYWPEDKWGNEILEDLNRVLKSFGITDTDFTVNILEDRDWNATWAASLEPIRLGRKVRIRQSWHAPDPSFRGIDLVIDPRRAFGTGYHATTQLVIEWLEENIKGGERILDIGTGSGILSMIALRLGAASALAVDIDPVAVECAGEYSELNGFGPELEFRVGSFEVPTPERYDVILANIDGRTLPELSGYLPGLLKEEGAACYSGLQEQDLEEVETVLEKVGFGITARTQRGEWLALEIKSSLRVKGKKHR